MFAFAHEDACIFIKCNSSSRAGSRFVFAEKKDAVGEDPGTN